MRAPEAPIGCPRDTAPPFTFTLAASSPTIWLLAIDTTANASLISQRSTSLGSQPARLQAVAMAPAGAVVNHSGAWACCPHDTIFAIGFTPFARAAPASMSTTAAPPSFKDDAFPA